MRRYLLNISRVDEGDTAHTNLAAGADDCRQSSISVGDYFVCSFVGIHSIYQSIPTNTATERRRPENLMNSVSVDQTRAKSRVAYITAQLSHKRASKNNAAKYICLFKTKR